MTGDLIRCLRSIIEPLHCDYRFEYDEASAMNVKADSVSNRAGLIYIEEITRGRYRSPQNRSQGYFFLKETSLSICFCRFSKELEAFASIGTTPLSMAVENTLTMTRQAIRDRIETEVVMPFIAALGRQLPRLLPGSTFGDMAFRYPKPGRFDANEVAIVLEFTITQQASCLDALK